MPVIAHTLGKPALSKNLTNSNKDKIQALDRLKSHHKWFDPQLFRTEALNFRTSPVLSKTINEWLKPSYKSPILVLREPFHGGAAVSKITSCLCAVEKKSDWRVVPCFSLRTPGRIAPPSKHTKFLDLLVCIIAGLLPTEETGTDLGQDALDLELLRQRNPHEARGFAFKTISDLLQQSRGRILLLIDEFSKYYDTSDEQVGDHWRQLLSVLARYHNPPDRTVRTLIRTCSNSEVLKSDGLLKYVVTANSNSEGAVTLWNVIRGHFTD